MKSSILHIVLCYLILFSPISFVFNDALFANAESINLSLLDDDCAETSNSYYSFLSKVEQSIQDEINKSIEDWQQHSENQAVFQKLQSLFHHSQLLKQAESTGNHFTAVALSYLHQGVFLIAQQSSSSYLSYVAPLIIFNLNLLFEVYLI